MKKLIISFFVVFTAVQLGLAQERSELNAEIREQRKALMQERQIASKTSGPIGQLVTAADVGEPDSFGKNALFLGLASGGIIIIDPTCDPNDIGPLGPDDHCITVADPTVQFTQTFNDVGRINIPGKSVLNIIYAIANHNLSYHEFNST